MSIIKLNDKYFKTFISEEKIQEAINELVNQVYDEHKDETPIFIGILNGCFMFVSDFVKKYKGNCEVNFVKLASYEGTQSTGKIKQLIGVNQNLEGRTVIILEDIIDTGNTLQEIYEIFKDKNLKQLKIATLFFKPDVFKKDLPIDHIGISIPDKFIVGFGLDYDGLGRNFDSIYQLTPEPIMKNIVLFGPPGAGKGTQANLLQEKFGLTHISTGEVFRHNIKNKTEVGIIAKAYIDEGNLVPDDVTIEMLKNEVNKHSTAKGFIFDGFPRTKPQAEALDSFLEEKGAIVNGMVALEAEEDILVNRILERGKTSGRPEDQAENRIRVRFNEYRTKTAVLKDYYQYQNKYFGVNALGSITEINNRLCDVIENF